MTLEMELKRRCRQGEAKGRAEGQALSALGMDMDLISQRKQLLLDAIKRLAKQNKLV